MLLFLSFVLLVLCYSTCWGKRWKDSGKAEEVLWRPRYRFIVHSITSGLFFPLFSCRKTQSKRRVEWEKKRGGERDSPGDWQTHRFLLCLVSLYPHGKLYAFFHVHDSYFVQSPCQKLTNKYNICKYICPFKCEITRLIPVMCHLA